MVAAGYLVEAVFTPLDLVPDTRNASMGTDGVHWNYTTWLNIVFLAIAAVLVVRFYRTGGGPMLKMMGGGPDDMAEHGHHH
jgi:hypothetical protein